MAKRSTTAGRSREGEEDVSILSTFTLNQNFIGIYYDIFI